MRKKYFKKIFKKSIDKVLLFAYNIGEQGLLIKPKALWRTFRTLRWGRYAHHPFEGIFRAIIIALFFLFICSYN